MKKTIKLLKSNQTRGQFDTDTISIEDRTVDLVWTTGYKGLRTTRSGFQYYEELAVTKNAINTTHMVGNPLLANHDTSNLDSTIGVIEDVRINEAAGEARSKVRFSDDEFSDRVFKKVQNKILRNVSVGYNIDDFKEVTQEKDEIPTYRAERWTPYEISIVPIGFDPGAQVRNQEINLTEVEIEVSSDDKTITEEKSVMTEEEKRALELAAAKKAADAEKLRQAEIREAVRNAKVLDMSFADELCNQDITPDEARKQVLKKLATLEPAPIKSTTSNDLQVGKDEKDKKREAAENALLHRVMPESFTLNDAGRDMRGLSLPRIVSVLTNSPFGSDAELAKRALSSDDLAYVMANVAEKSVQKAYETAPHTYEQWTNAKTLRNYKKHHETKVGDFPSLAERGEDGEFIEGSFSDGEELVQLKKFGRVLSFTEEMIANDDMNILADFLRKAGQKGRNLEAKLVYDRLAASTAMADGVALFHANHGNLGTAGAPSETTFDEAIQLMKAQKTLDSEDYLDLLPKFLLCGPKVETAAKKFLATILANQTSNVNIFAGSVTPIVDPRITDKKWYLVADKSRVDSIVLYRLLGKEQPEVQTRVKWETGAFQIKVAHTAAAQAMEHRGIVRNPYA